MHMCVQALSFSVLSDAGSKVAKTFGVGYDITETNIKLLQGFGIDTKALYGS
jgi:hypothetical protein